jgi:adenylate cyclase
MTVETPTRALAAIVSIDIAGYSAASEQDESAAVTMVQNLRAAAGIAAERYRGRIFNTAGDGIMLTFVSATDALQATLDLLKEFSGSRFGIHLGEVLEADGGDLLGHGVNVAARLQQMAPVGKGLVSEDVKRAVRGPLADRLVPHGQLQLNKMESAIDTYVLDSGAPEPVSTASAFRQPLIAVLPFDNLSGDTDMVYFSDGISDEILQTIAQTTRLKVIGRSSSFQFRGTEKAAHRVATALRCTHMLDGSVRRSGNRVRIAASLVECSNQTQLWSDRFERDLSNVFALQDEIAAAVAKALNSRFAPSPAVGPIAPEAYDLFLKARTIGPGWVNDRFAAWLGSYDRASLEKATAISPNFAKAWAALAMTRGLERGQVESFETWSQDVTSAANRALSLDPSTGIAYAALALLEPPCGRFTQIDALLEKALAVSPNDPDVLIQASLHTYKEGRVQQAQTYAARAYEVDPLYDQAECWHGMMLLQTGRVEEAFAVFDSARTRKPQFDMLTDFPMIYAAGLGQWDMVDRLRNAVPKEVRHGEHAVQSDQLVNFLELFFRPASNPLVSLGRRIARPLAASSLFSTMQKQKKETGMVALGYIPVAATIGKTDEVYDFVDTCDFSPLLRPGGRHLPGDAGLQLLFEWHAKPLRRDPRFAKLCARLGLANYYLDTGHWPDCAAEVAPYYDFRKECAEAVKL